MTLRDLAWRTAGGAMILAGCASSVLESPASAGAGVTLAGFAVAIAGIVLAVQGKRVALALRIERSRHRHLPALLHAHRKRRAPRREA